ncbi:hypothetical protein fgpv_229 [Flamingopox virus FGPVKD09]|uniref:Uncharacterized protein n=1 Tax=Flamingopox virus FGPVKD09 TaxID=2059380 RepID=A0A2H4X2M5_9POXV|nr:hypothetical protein C1178_gp229 [Flamingopox virus FGPVKD09]AUD40323.1 hypothetical protein fgpv_229 [Flamingopox virus FGPVKD09]
MERVKKCFSNIIFFSKDVDTSMFSPNIVYSGLLDSYNFSFVDALLVVNMSIGIARRRETLCNKCTNICILNNQIKLLLEFGYRDDKNIIKKGSVSIGLLNMDAKVHITTLFPPCCNFMDAKVLNFNLLFPECDCLFVDVKMNIADESHFTPRYLFVSPLQDN